MSISDIGSKNAPDDFEVKIKSMQICPILQMLINP